MILEREQLKLDFLKSCNLNNVERIKLKADASNRRYERIIASEDKSFILMDAPPEKEETIPFMKMANFLKENDFSAPLILESDSDKGFILLEDFGDDSFNNILLGKSNLSSTLSEEKIYEKAIDVLINLHGIQAPKISLPHYSEDLLIKESNQFIDWYVATLNGQSLESELKEEFNFILKQLFLVTKIYPDVVVLRDYHVDNLMWLNDRVSYRKVGLLDFQDAVIGSPIYDLISLLEDARRDVSPQLTEHMINRYLKAHPNYSRKDFNMVYAILAIQRNLKIAGFCARQAASNKNPFYLTLLPRVWGYINNDLKHPLLHPLKNWLSKVVSIK